MKEPTNETEARNERDVSTFLPRAVAEHIDADDFDALEASGIERIADARRMRAAAHLRKCEPCAARQIEWVIRHVETHHAATGNVERDTAFRSTTLARLIAHDEPSVSIAACNAVGALGLWTDEVVSALVSAQAEQLDSRAVEAASASLAMVPAEANAERELGEVAAMAAVPAAASVVAAWGGVKATARAGFEFFFVGFNQHVLATADAFAADGAPVAHHEEGPYRAALTRIDDELILDVVAFMPELVGQTLEVRVGETRVCKVVLRAGEDGGRDCVKVRTAFPSRVWQVPGGPPLEVLPLD